MRNRTDKEEAKNTYANYLNNFPAGSEQFSSKEHVEKEIENGSILQLPGDRRSRVFTGDGEGGLISRAPGIGLDIEKKRLSDEATVKKVSELLESSASYVGVFSVLYTTLLTTNEM
ncbi:hypothetical protein FACS1894176_03740 [Bacteroidia bacterium]|nr:hypothetical protein FACS1894176_03740 [Bacteroidia bacterium]